MGLQFGQTEVQDDLVASLRHFLMIFVDGFQHHPSMPTRFPQDLSNYTEPNRAQEQGLLWLHLVDLHLLLYYLEGLQETKLLWGAAAFLLARSTVPLTSMYGVSLSSVWSWSCAAVGMSSLLPVKLKRTPDSLELCTPWSLWGNR